MAVDASRLEAAVREYADARARDLADEFVARAQSRTSRRSGRLFDSIHREEPSDSGGEITVTVVADARSDSGDAYAEYQDEGTGIYGPSGMPITPKNAKVLRFDWPAAGGIVFAHSVEGSPGTHFWSDTLEDWSNIVRGT